LKPLFIEKRGDKNGEKERTVGDGLFWLPGGQLAKADGTI